MVALLKVPCADNASFPARRHRFNNGLTLIHQRMAMPVVTVDVWVKAGAAVEPEAWSGGASKG